MADISDVYNAEGLVNYYTTLKNGGDPHYKFIGESLFPNAKRKGLRLDWIKGLNGIPAVLKQSNLDASAIVRPRVPVGSIQTKIPYFKEAMTFSEEERQEMADLLRLHGDNPTFIQSLMKKTYRDYANLLAGADVQAERMRMNLLAYGKIYISVAGSQSEFDYDDNSEWANNNTIALAGNAKWTDANVSTSDPINDLVTAIEDHRIKNGVETRKILMNSVTFRAIAKSESVKKAIAPLGGTVLNSQVEALIKDATKAAQIILNDAVYKDESGTTQKYYPDGYVSLLPDTSLGFTNYGTTPTEFDILNDLKSELNSVALYNDGVAVSTKKTVDPVQVHTIVEQLVLPSFEEMQSVYVINAF